MDTRNSIHFGVPVRNWAISSAIRTFLSFMHKKGTCCVNSTLGFSLQSLCLIEQFDCVAPFAEEKQSLRHGIGTHSSCKQGQYKTAKPPSQMLHPKGHKDMQNQNTPRTFRGHRTSRGHPIGVVKTTRKTRLDVGLSFAWRCRGHPSPRTS